MVILGDMRELGEHSAEAHRQVGALTAEAGAFLFIGCGESMHDAIEVASARGIDTL